MESLRVQVMLGQVKGEGGWDQEQFIPMELLEVREASKLIILPGEKQE